MCPGNACQAKEGPRPARYHHFCYLKYCSTILKAQLHEEEMCNYCMDCRSPNTMPIPLRTEKNLTDGDGAEPAKRAGRSNLKRRRSKLRCQSRLRRSQAAKSSPYLISISSNIIIYHSISWAHRCVLVFVYHDVYHDISCGIMNHDTI